MFKDDIAPEAIKLIHEFYALNPDQPMLLRMCADVIENLEANKLTPRILVTGFVQRVYAANRAKTLVITDAGGQKLLALLRLAQGGAHLNASGALPLVALGDALGANR